MVDQGNIALEQSVELCIGALAAGICDDIARYRASKGREPRLLTLVEELRMDVSFILLDLCTSYIACCKEERPYACIYHVKNLDAVMLEAYKMLYSYGKFKKHTVWHKLGLALNDEPAVRLPKHDQYLRCYQEVSAKLHGKAGTESDKEHRDLTFHYDAYMKKVYDYTVSISSPKEAEKKMLSFMEVLQEIQSLCKEIEEGLQSAEYAVEDGTAGETIGSKYLDLIGELGKSGLEEILDDVLRDVTPIDEIAKHIGNFEKLEEMARGEVEIPELSHVFTMLNMHLTVLFMRADIAANTKAFLHSRTEGEAMLNMRRYMITTVSVFDHLYGYSDDKRVISLWSQIEAIIPADAIELKGKAVEIGELLGKVVRRQDMDLRTVYVHLMNNSTYESNVDIIVDALSQQNPPAEMGRVNVMMQVTKQVMDFLSELMEVLSAKAHTASEESSAQLKALVEKVKSQTESDNIPEELKEKIIAAIEMVEKVTSRE